MTRRVCEKLCTKKVCVDFFGFLKSLGWFLGCFLLVFGDDRGRRRGTSLKIWEEAGESRGVGLRCLGFVCFGRLGI